MENPDYTRIEGNVKAVNAVVNRYASTVSQYVDVTLERVSDLSNDITALQTLKIASYRIAVVRSTLAIHTVVTLKINEIYYHRSPQIMAIILSVYTFVNFVSNVINFLRTVASVIRIIMTISDILTLVWPQYREFINKVYQKVSDFSAALGWGVDGLLHILNAVNGGVGVAGALMGKDWNIMQVEWGQTVVDTATSLSRALSALQDDPGAYIKNLVQNRVFTTSTEINEWWTDVFAFINEGLDRGKEALNHTVHTLNELNALRNFMPVLIANNIPSAIWDSLESADSFIHDNIMPGLSRIDSLVKSFETTLQSNNKALANLAGKLAHPGQLLQDVDDLPGFVKKDEEGRIDDVTSREFEYWTNTERIEIEHDLHEFDRIDSLLKAPTPEPEYMGLEIPEGKTIRGVTAEPHETWFIDGYNDQH